jgi:hypothetical protein
VCTEAIQSNGISFPPEINILKADGKTLAWMAHPGSATEVYGCMVLLAMVLVFIVSTRVLC